MSPSRRLTGPHPTLATVAERAGVSRQTVSNALNNPELLREDTLARVQAVIEELGYTPNRAARALRTRASHMIGLRFEPAQEGTSNALIDRFVHSLVEATARTGHHIILFSGDPDDLLDGYDELLRATAVDAFVITDTYAGTPQVDLLDRVGAPFVTFGRPWDDPSAKYPWVDVDGARGAELATEHLIAAGHQRIAWLGWEKTSRIGEDRRSGWSRALAAAGIDAAGLGVRITDNVDAARMAAHELLEDGTVTGFACASDTIAIGVLHALAERNLRPGADVGVVGFDDSLGAQVTWPGLTSVRQPLEQVAIEVIDLLHTVLSLKTPENPARMLEPSLVVRRSTRRD
ncbi:LacI family DNA-binding transcriptional regulator [Nocardioides marmorisolisilvae]|uniref:LacI family transcriptional regulator n=1 Tax=Nocardioides marmorisolisilvae TaxID=1542737 RepID=A0A3N0E162_9ACTN|nr:LacI family DNA-binding transcriptional regulator [Nocardioides marmorisolisilvae]RNL81483.1 LacI family transcriptional regulator [Nocardioides marmorisolisilvae]